jgi:histidine triad (HIT) family protein
MDCIFCKIINGDIPSDRVFESERILAFRDINPAAPEHILVVPKKHIKNLESSDESDREYLADIFYAVKNIAQLKSLTDKGYRIILNNGRAAGQEVDHIHMHILGGRENMGPMLTR